MKKTLVIAHYNEDLNWVGQIPADWQIIVYHKGGWPLGFVMEMTTRTDVQVIGLENVGREGDTFLWHMQANYDELEGVLAFVQGRPSDHITIETLCEVLDDPDLTEHSTCGLGTWLTCDQYAMPHHWEKLNMEMLSALAGVDIDVNAIDFVAGGQWLVGAKVIRQHEVWKYKILRQQLLQHVDWGYCLERLWARLWTPKYVSVLYFSHHSDAEPKIPIKLANLVVDLLDMNRPASSEMVAVVTDQRGGELATQHRDWYYLMPPEEIKTTLRIYKIIERGLTRISPGDLVFLAEHDVLYPATYYRDGDRRYQPGKVGYNNNVFFLSAEGYYTYRPITLLSCCYGEQSVLLKAVRDHIRHLETVGDSSIWDLARSPEIPTPWFQYNATYPVVDVRFEQDGLTNTTPTATVDKGHVFYESLPYWGPYKVWTEELGLASLPGQYSLERRDTPILDPAVWIQQTDPHK